MSGRPAFSRSERSNYRHRSRGRTRRSCWIRRSARRPTPASTPPDISSGETLAGSARDGAVVAEVTGLVDLNALPAGSRLIVREKRPHAGADLSLFETLKGCVTPRS
jgi:hypothetical protein